MLSAAWLRKNLSCKYLIEQLPGHSEAAGMRPEHADRPAPSARSQPLINAPQDLVDVRPRLAAHGLRGYGDGLPHAVDGGRTSRTGVPAHRMTDGENACATRSRGAAAPLVSIDQTLAPPGPTNW